MLSFLLFHNAKPAMSAALAAMGRDGHLRAGMPSIDPKGRLVAESPVWTARNQTGRRSVRLRDLSLGGKALRVLRMAGRAILYFHVVFVAITVLLVALYGKVDPPVTVLALSRKFLDGWTVSKPRPVSLAQVPRTVRRMLVSVEDSKFWTHAGFDPEAIRRAMTINKDLGKPLAGGSTLTMQTARTLFLVPVKSYLRKYLEAIVTVELEVLLSKERILELYFSWAEWGKGVFGIEAAARAYYKKGVAALSLDESARVLAILSSPIRYTPFTLAKRGQLLWRYEYLVRKYGG